MPPRSRMPPSAGAGGRVGSSCAACARAWRAAALGAVARGRLTVKLDPCPSPLLLATLPPVPAEGGMRDLGGMRVLVVDDEIDARELIKRILSDCNATVITAANAAEALRMVEQERPGLLVSDIGMPDVDGFELLAQIRALGPGRGGAVPAIALTAFARSEDRLRALECGFRDHVSKPVEPAELVRAVALAAHRR